MTLFCSDLPATLAACVSVIVRAARGSSCFHLVNLFYMEIQDRKEISQISTKRPLLISGRAMKTRDVGKYKLQKHCTMSPHMLLESRGACRLAQRGITTHDAQQRRKTGEMTESPGLKDLRAKTSRGRQPALSLKTSNSWGHNSAPVSMACPCS